jgi:hypothetical protein
VKFSIPRTTRFLPLQEYAPDEPTLAGVGIQVWVDPPKAVMVEFDQINREFSQVLNKLGGISEKDKKKTVSPAEKLMTWLNMLTNRARDERFKSASESYRRALNAWYARLWSQAADPETHWTVDELEQIGEENPRLFEWLCISSWALIERHRDDVKKGYRGPSVKSPGTAEPATPS